MDFRIIGLHHLQNIDTKSVIFASNHTSELDPILLPAALPPFSRFSPIFFVSREKNFYDPTFLKRIFYGGTFFKLWGAYPAWGGMQNYERSLKTHASILKKGNSLMIFPEGRIPEKENHRVEPRGGVGWLAEFSHATVVPVKISGAFRITLKDFFSKKRKVSIEFFPPMKYETLFGPGVSRDIASYKAVAKSIMDVVHRNP